MTQTSDQKTIQAKQPTVVEQVQKLWHRGTATIVGLRVAAPTPANLLKGRV